MAALYRHLRSRLGLVSRLKTPVYTNSPCIYYSSTSKKVEQSEFVIGKQTEIDPKRVEEIIEEGKRSVLEQHNPDSPYYEPWGFSKDNHDDLFTKRALFFIGISLLFVVAPFYLHYLPDKDRRKWAYREARIELERRRENGLPLIDPDFVPREKILADMAEWEE